MALYQYVYDYFACFAGACCRCWIHFQTIIGWMLLEEDYTLERISLLKAPLSFSLSLYFLRFLSLILDIHQRKNAPIILHIHTNIHTYISPSSNAFRNIINPASAENEIKKGKEKKMERSLDERKNTIFHS